MEVKGMLHFGFMIMVWAIQAAEIAYAAEGEKTLLGGTVVRG